MNIATHNDNTTGSFLTTLVGGLVALIGGLSTAEQMAIVGVLIAFAGFIVNTWYVWRKDRREQLIFEQKIGKGTDE